MGSSQTLNPTAVKQHQVNTLVCVGETPEMCSGLGLIAGAAKVL
jgi:hypothetical protein